jgi:hypothetical protein
MLDQEPGRGDTFDRGDDYRCPNCYCEIRVQYHGDRSRVERPRPFLCYCGTEMRKEPR